MGTAGIHPDLLSIVAAGVQAPSADNRHCFEVQATCSEILLFGDETYLSAPYHKKVLSLISFGAVVENMAVRAARLGYCLEPIFLPDSTQPSLIAALRLVAATPVVVAHDAAIATRQTNRRMVFSGPALSKDELGQFTRLSSGIDGVTVDFFDEGGRRRELLRLVRIAETERFNTQAMHADLFSAVRFDVGWRSSATEGLPPAALAVEPGARWAFSQIARWPVMNALRHFGVHHALGVRAGALPCRFAPHLGVLSMCLPVEPGALGVGRVLQRLWLEAESRGLAMQPFAGAGLLALPDYRAVPFATGEALRHGWTALIGDRTPLMVFRLGWAKRPAFRTGRLAPERYFRD